MRALGLTLVSLTDKRGRMGYTLNDLKQREPRFEEYTETPGRAIYALCLLSDLDNDPVWKQTALRIGQYRLGPEGRDTTRTPWDVIGLARLYLTTGQENFYAGTYVQASALLGAVGQTYQLVRKKEGIDTHLLKDRRVARFYWPGFETYPDYIGGFTNRTRGNKLLPPDVESAASRLRALAAAYKVGIAKDPRALNFRDTIRQVALPIARFLMRHQYQPGNTFYIDKPQVVEGAFRSAPANFRVELSSTCQAISALMDCMEVYELDKHVVPPESNEHSR